MSPNINDIKEHNMSDYERVTTSVEVWAVIRARHPEMQVFGSYSAPAGNPDIIHS